VANIIESSLRDYQRQAVEAIERQLFERGRATLVMPHGTGKSRVLVELTRRVSEKLPTLIIVGSVAAANQLSYFYREFFGENFSRLLSEDGRNHEILSEVPEEADFYPVDIVNLQRLEREFVFHGRYELVVVLDIKLSAVLQQDLISGKFSNAKKLFVESIRSIKYEEFAGPPAYEYTLKQAVSEGNLRSIEYNVLEKVNFDEFDNIDYVRQMFGGFIDRESENEIAKVLVVCDSVKNAEKLYSSLLKIREYGNPYLIHSGVRSHTNLIREFVNSDEKSIAIVVNLIVGVDFSGLTDLVLLKRFPNERDFLYAISRINRLALNLGKGRVWDFSGNQIYFNSDLGEIKNVGVGKIDGHIGGGEHIAELVIPLEDKPAKVDLLGRKGLVDILKGLIERDTKDHLIIALFGRWGSGKSSVIQMLRDKYEKTPNRNFIEFNAWQAEHSNSMSASIAQQLVNDLYGAEGFLGQVLLSYKARILQSKAELIKEFVFVAIVTAFCFGFALPGLVEDFKLRYGTLAALSISLPAVFSIVISYLKHPFTGQLKELAKRPNFKEHIGLGHAIREQIFCLLSVYPLSFWQVVKKAIGKTINHKHKYILVIDDLDRCSDKKIIETLEAIQLIVDLPCVNILLAVAPDVLIDAVASRYMGQRSGLSEEAGKQLARDFLGKVLQITITLDNPSALNRNQFINARLYAAVEKQKKTNDEPVKKIILEKQKPDVPEEILDFTDFVDEAEEAYDRTESYLQSNNEEYEFFVKCSEHFDIHNPRTLIRIHNAITLLKGMYPAIYKHEGMLNHYIYLTFWHEVYATVDAAQKKIMLGIILPDDSDDVLHGVMGSNSNQLIGFENIDRVQIKTMLFRVKNMSLPAVEHS
jgi:hypothetical protein